MQQLANQKSHVQFAERAFLPNIFNKVLGAFGYSFKADFFIQSPVALLGWRPRLVVLLLLLYGLLVFYVTLCAVLRDCNNCVRVLSHMSGQY